ncbi:unnamed protein product [Rotaria sp. Silwood1]|nr:unnamed protein product [Rotaria sp. Silwood1]
MGYPHFHLASGVGAVVASGRPDKTPKQHQNEENLSGVGAVVAGRRPDKGPKQRQDDKNLSGVGAVVAGGNPYEAPEQGQNGENPPVVGAVVAGGRPNKRPKQHQNEENLSDVGAVVAGGRPDKASKQDENEDNPSGVGAVVAGGKKDKAPKRSQAKETPAPIGAVVASTDTGFVPEKIDHLYVAQSVPRDASSVNPSVGDVTPNQPSVDVPKEVEAVVAGGKGRKRKSKVISEKLSEISGQPQGKKVIKLPSTSKMILLGRRYDVTDQESNRIRDITIDSIPQDYLNTDIDSRYLGLLYYLLRGRQFRQQSFTKKLESSACAPQDVYVNYVYEYDIHNQVFNSSFQDPNSIVIQSLQSDIARYTAEELYKRNLVSYVTDEARLIRVMDVSKQYKDRATLRFYVSINVSKNLIPIIQHVFETVFTKVQNERFATSNKKIDWGEMLLIPITK